LNIFITLTMLIACSSPHQQAPVTDRHQPPSSKLDAHTVSKGDTLFSIAWRYGLDYKQLARRNGLSLQSTIYPGQKLRLDVGNVSSKSTQKADRVVTKTRAQTKRPVKETTAPKIRSHSVTNKSPIAWNWPVKGKLLKAYSNTNGLNKGIDIAGKLGEPVTSAGSGVVVYAGSGIRGYGNLLIIKHNDYFLSAYAHSQKLLVKEGARVKTGQRIAEMGSSGTDRVKLHFEIRRDGKPVDPLRYLPKR
jgi:lipoprotein NlpD